MREPHHTDVYSGASVVNALCVRIGFALKLGRLGGKLSFGYGDSWESNVALVGFECRRLHAAYLMVSLTARNTKTNTAFNRGGCRPPSSPS